MGQSTREEVYVAEALLEALCQLAADRDPSGVVVPLAMTDGRELDVDLPSGTSVFTHFFLPETGHSVRAVFGVDLGTPSRSTPGLFLSHPDGRHRITRQDDLREVILIAVPPWRPEEIRAFDRRGRRLKLTALDLTLPDEVPP